MTEDKHRSSSVGTSALAVFAPTTSQDASTPTHNVSSTIYGVKYNQITKKRQRGSSREVYSQDATESSPVSGKYREIQSNISTGSSKSRSYDAPPDAKRLRSENPSHISDLEVPSHVSDSNTHEGLKAPTPDAKSLRSGAHALESDSESHSHVSDTTTHEALRVPSDATGEILVEYMQLCIESIQSYGKIWEELIKVWIQVEARYKYGAACNNRRLSSKNRPKAIDSWIRYNRRHSWTPSMAKVLPKEIAVDFGRWWAGLQIGRNLDGEGLLVKDKNGVTERKPGANWSKITVAGKNGMLSVIAALYFWRISLEPFNKEQEMAKEWVCAVKDVTYALQEVMKL